MRYGDVNGKVEIAGNDQNGELLAIARQDLVKPPSCQRLTMQEERNRLRRWILQRYRTYKAQLAVW